ncbi:leucine-rich repeat protein [Butyrivibrio sp. YAB3001]|uniref:leucine-rich repeat protein n=1 Tax=Butyrivibrio sp. YAB3001 TaxID=1520812 RepID=UPI000B823E3D|nr:leucine-rich repeat protein [Butyrivibrio sp. YAB3001]
MKKNYLKTVIFMAAMFMLMVLTFKVPAKAASPVSKTQYENAVSKILSGMNKSWSDEEKLFYLHDYLVTHIQYDGTYSNYSAYDALVNHVCVCQGYAAAFDDLANRAGIPAAMVTSNAMRHGWNAVKVNNKWYYIDCTWDDPTGPSNPRYCSHDNFLRSESGMRTTKHTGNDWRTAHIAYDSQWIYGTDYVEYVSGKYNDSTYDKMTWTDETTVPVALLSNGVVYYNSGDNTVYAYKCNRKQPSKVVVAEGYYPSVSVTGSGKNAFISVNNEVYYYKIGSTANKVYTLSGNEKESGTITSISISGKDLRYNIGDYGYGYYKDTVKRVEYVNMTTASQMRVSEVSITDKTIRHIKPKKAVTIAITSSGPGTLTWKSDNTAVATVSATGKVTGKKAGTCRITVTNGTAKDSCIVVVDGGTDTNQAVDAVGKADSSWLKNFEYVYTDAQGYIYPVGYKGNAANFTVPATAVYRQKKYKTAFNGSFFTEKSKIVNLKFEKGVVICPGYTFVLNNDSIKSIDFRGGVIKKNSGSGSRTQFSIAYNCPNLTTVNMKGLDLSGVQGFSMPYECDSLKTIVMPKYFDSTNSTWNDGDWRIYSNNQYGTVTYNYLNEAPANATLKLAPSPKKKGATFTQNNVTYKITDANNHKVAATKIQGTTVVIPSIVTCNGVKYMVTAIGANAASKNTTLKSLTIGSCVQTIGENAFYKCSKLTTINVQSGMITKIKAKAFNGVSSKAVVTVPADCKSSYKKMLKNAGLSTKATVK